MAVTNFWFTKSYIEAFALANGIKRIAFVAAQFIACFICKPSAVYFFFQPVYTAL